MPTRHLSGVAKLNVACGRSLTAGLSGQKNKLDHRTIEAEDHDAVYRARHGVTFVEDGWWHKLTDRTQAQVNSLHNQAIDRLAQGLVADAHAEDGTIEGVYKPDQGFVSAFNGMQNIKQVKIICPNRCSRVQYRHLAAAADK